MQQPRSTNQQLNKLIEFRQALYQQGFPKRRDAQFELLDALLLSPPIRSFPELSLSPIFRRQWPSAYAAVEAGRQDAEWLRQFLGSQVPTQGVQVFALDTSGWPRPSAPTLPDRQYVHRASPGSGGNPTVIGYPYSELAWVAQGGSSWALPVDLERIPSSSDALAVGVAQVQKLCQRRGPPSGRLNLDVITADGGYGNHRFLQPLRDQPCGVLVRLRRDRVLYSDPPVYPGRGRPRIHGASFAFKQPQTWGEPQQHHQFQDHHWGRVEIQYWSGLHARQAPAAPFGVLRVQVRLDQRRPPQALWLGWQGPPWPAVALWRYYQRRWSIEPSFRWRKQQLYWTTPQFQSPEVADRWSILVSLAQWVLFLASGVVADQPLPWQKAQQQLTPGRVQQGLAGLFQQIGTPAQPPKTRGKPPGWPKGLARPRPARFPVARKGPPRAKSRGKAA
jgi:hypothetical protein